jgi:plastocyanin
MKFRLYFLIAMVVFSGCAGDTPAEGLIEVPAENPEAPIPPPPPSPAPETEEDKVQPPPGSVANFDMIDDAFVDDDGNMDAEAEATVKPGQMVSWTHNGKVIHRVEFSDVPPDARSRDSKDLRPGATWSFFPSVAGRYVFFCRYHEYMMDSTIYVDSAAAQAP